MTPYEALYGRKCKTTPLCWFDTRENFVLGLDMILHITEKTKLLGKN